jgi:Cof subfamily protein (haloacid dehalogenase superfamily)
MYKLVAIDLDGTLLNSYGEVSNENKHAIKNAINKGVEVVLSSGRIGDSVESIAHDLSANNYYISGNGSMLYNMQEDKIEYENFIEKEKMLKLIKICEENSIYYSIYTENMVITKSLKYNVAFYNYENSKKAFDKRTNINIVQNIYEYVKNLKNNKFLKITICDDSEIIFSRIIDKFKKINNIDVLDVAHMSRKIIKEGTEEVPVEYYYTEITNKNVDKWTAIEILIKKLNIKREEVIAIGDNMNDKLMIKNAGIGVAMGQANPKIKEIADFITQDNNNNGVANILNKLI